MATPKLLTVSLAALLGVHSVQGNYTPPRRPVIATERPVIHNEARSESGAKFLINQIRNPGYQGKSGLQEMIEVYRKYGVPLTPQLRKAAQVNKQLAASQKSAHYLTRFS
jgi:hypothetical protein